MFLKLLQIDGEMTTFLRTFFWRKTNKIQRYGTVVFTSTLNYLPVYITSLFTVFALHSWKKDMIFWFRILQMVYFFYNFFFVYLNYSKYIKLSLLISIYYSFCSVQIDIRNLSVSRQILSEIQSSQGYVI